MKRKALGGPKEHEDFEAWDRDHPIVELFSVPNLLDCSYDLWAYTTLFYLLTGWANWWVMRNSFGVPVELWVIPTHWMRLVTGRDGMPEAYAIQSPWGTLQYAAYDDVLSFYDHSPLDRYEGYSIPLMIGDWLDAYEAMVRSRSAQNFNGAIPAFHVSLSDEYVDPDEAMLNRYYSKWFARFQGPDRAGLPLITGPGVEVKALGITPVEMDYVNMENQYRDMMLAALRVPKGVLGMDPASDTSAWAPQNQFTRFAINPFLTLLGQRITHGLLRRTPNLDDGICFWDAHAIDDPATLRNNLQMEIANKLTTPNEARVELGREPYPFGGDNPIDVTTGQELNWATGGQQPEHAELEASFQRAAGRRLAIENDPDHPMVVDKDDEEAVGPNLRWYRTRDGHLEARGQQAKWYIERTPKGYLLHKDDQHFDSSRAVGLLKQVAEDEEQKALVKGMSEAAGGTGGFLIAAARKPPAEVKDFGQRYVPNSTAGGRTDSLVGSMTPPPEGVSIEDRRRLNAEVDEDLKRYGGGPINGKSMVVGNGKAH